jgi:ZIP family zinc transporter
VNPTITVLLYSSIAAAAAALGVVPLLFRRRLPELWVAWASAMAAGLMLGAAFVLFPVGIGSRPLGRAIGALLGILFINWTHAVTDTEEIDLSRQDDQSPAYGYKVLLIHMLHAGSEGIAIAVAMVASLPVGIFTAVAIAAHNIPESTMLCSVLNGRGVRLREASGLAVATNLTQVLLAVSIFAIVTASPGVFPWMVGFAVGALVNLVMIELLPACYGRAGTTGIAVVTSVAMGILVLIRGFLP